MVHINPEMSFADNKDENPLVNPEVETYPTATYEEYRMLCDDEGDSYRKTGLLDADKYYACLADEHTVFCIINGQKTPAIVSIDYEDGYDAERCRSLTQRQQTMLLSIPSQRVRQGALLPGNIMKSNNNLDDMAVLIEEPDNEIQENRGSDHLQITSMLSSLGNFEPREFIDQRLIGQDGQETASMILFSGSLTATAEAKQLPEVAGLNEAWEQYRKEKDLPESRLGVVNEPYIFTAQQLKEDKELVDSLWDISQEGFGKMLGVFHPVSMEESRNFFESQIFANDTYSIVRFHEGKPICFGSFTTDIQNCQWLNVRNPKLNQELASSREHNETPMFFSEIISTALGATYSSSILKLIYDIGARSGNTYRLFFENTNLSVTYIPRMLERVLSRQNMARFSDVQERFGEVDRLDYWYAVTGGMHE